MCGASTAQVVQPSGSVGTGGATRRSRVTTSVARATRCSAGSFARSTACTSRCTPKIALTAIDEGVAQQLGNGIGELHLVVLTAYDHGDPAERNGVWRHERRGLQDSSGQR